MCKKAIFYYIKKKYLKKSKLCTYRIFLFQQPLKDVEMLFLHRYRQRDGGGICVMIINYSHIFHIKSFNDEKKI